MTARALQDPPMKLPKVVPPGMASQKLALVTGGAGFIGSHLCRRLVQEGYRVISLDNYFTGSRDEKTAAVEYREGHTKDIAKLIPETPDIIFHLGEYSRVEKSLEEPALVWDLNVAGTFGVLEFWRARKCKLVYAGSSTKFGDGGLARVATPYAWTKAANTELVKNYGDWYKLPFAITYFYNVYGPGERSGAYGTVIEIFRQKFLAAGTLTVVSPGTQKRNFTYIDDIIDGLVLVGEKGEGDEFGLGDERQYSVMDIALMFGTEIEMLPERAGNRMSSAIDTTRSKALGWEVKHSVAEYIQRIVSKKA
jgi:UDP-glucose 4-epimerase